MAGLFVFVYCKCFYMESFCLPLALDDWGTSFYYQHNAEVWNRFALMRLALFVCMFPHPLHSLCTWDASSKHLITFKNDSGRWIAELLNLMRPHKTNLAGCTQWKAWLATMLNRWQHQSVASSSQPLYEKGCLKSNYKESIHATEELLGSWGIPVGSSPKNTDFIRTFIRKHLTVPLKQWGTWYNYLICFGAHCPTRVHWTPLGTEKKFSITLIWCIENIIL